MNPVHHTIASAGVSAVYAYVTRSWPGTIACFLSGIFIDIDHIIDYAIAKKKISFSYKELMAFCAYQKSGKLYLIFHSYELFALVWGAIWFFNLGPVWLGTAIGASFHLFLDEIFNPLRPKVYFFTYRLMNGFDKKAFFPEEHYEGLES